VPNFGQGLNFKFVQAGSIHLRVDAGYAGGWMFDNEIDWVNTLQG
jgi:hypothetical protein